MKSFFIYFLCLQMIYVTMSAQLIRKNTVSRKQFKDSVLHASKNQENEKTGEAQESAPKVGVSTYGINLDSITKVATVALREQMEKSKDIEQKHSALFAKLRKQYQTVMAGTYKDGSWDIRIANTNGCGLVDSIGKVIIPCKYSYIEKLPAIAEGYSHSQFQKNISESIANEMGDNSFAFDGKVWHKKTPATYLAVKEKTSGLECITHFSIYSTEGKILLDNVEGDPGTSVDRSINLLPGYIDFQAGTIASPRHGLCTTDGVIILPANYKDFKLTGRICYMHAWDEEIGLDNKCGAAILDNSLKPVPCIYKEKDIKYDEAKNAWSINQSSKNDFVEMLKRDSRVPSQLTLAELFHKGDYLACIIKGISNASDGKIDNTDNFYLGKSIYNLANQAENTTKLFMKVIKNGKMDELYTPLLDISNRERYLASYVNLKALLPLFNISQKFLESYIASMNSNTTDTIAKKNIRSAKSDLTMLNVAKKYISTDTKNYEEQWALFEAENKKLKLLTDNKWDDAIPDTYLILSVATAYGLITQDTNLYEMFNNNVNITK